MNDDIHALSGAYAADALDDIERARFERHLANCAVCQAEVASLAAAASELSALAELPPPPSLRDRVMRDITMVRPLPPVAPESSAQNLPPTPPSSAQNLPRKPDGGRPIRPWRWLAAAAAAAVLTIGGLGYWRSLSNEAPAPTVAEQVLAAPDATRLEQSFPGGATATLVRSTSLRRAVLVTSKMPAAPTGRVYQLWLQDSTGHMTSAGVMPPGSDQVVILEGDASKATAAGISVEPAGGSREPTSAPIALFAFT
jgi:anti-sigma-K factor RskA